jgi:bifunctional non-homologous end joining protein LigD
VVETLPLAGLAPQRPRYLREISEPESHILEPEWTGTRALVRIGHTGPRFLGYSGEVEAPRELYEAISATASCSTATLDGVLVAEWQDERDLELDEEGNAFTRVGPTRQIFAAFDLLEVDGQRLLDVPLLERKRHLEGLLAQSPNVRLTTYVTRALRSWRDTLAAQGFPRVVLKDWNSAYAPGQTNASWTVIEKFRGSR